MLDSLIHSVRHSLRSLALASSTLSARLLYGVQFSDVWAFVRGGVVLVLAMTAALACLVPTLQAARVSPLEALRDE